MQILSYYEKYYKYIAFVFCDVSDRLDQIDWTLVAKRWDVYKMYKFNIIPFFSTVFIVRIVKFVTQKSRSRGVYPTYESEQQSSMAMKVQVV